MDLNIEVEHTSCRHGFARHYLARRGPVKTEQAPHGRPER